MHCECPIIMTFSIYTNLSMNISILHGSMNSDQRTVKYLIKLYIIICSVRHGLNQFALHISAANLSFELREREQWLL